MTTVLTAILVVGRVVYDFSSADSTAKIFANLNPLCVFAKKEYYAAFLLEPCAPSDDFTKPRLRACETDLFGNGPPAAIGSLNRVLDGTRARTGRGNPKGA